MGEKKKGKNFQDMPHGMFIYNICKHSVYV